MKQSDKLKMMEKEVLKSKDQQIEEMKADLSLLQSSINEVYILLIEAQNEARHYKKQTEFDLSIIKEIKANAARAKLQFEEELSKRAAELY